MTELLLESSILKKKAGVNGVDSECSDARDTSKCTNQLCTDVVDTSHIFPDLCDECKKSGVVGDWMEKEPGLKLQVFRSWRSKHRETTQTKPEEAQQGDGSISDNAIEDDCENLETLECVATSSIPSNGTATTSTAQSPYSNARSVASSDTSTSTAPSLHDLKARVQRLRARTDQLIAKIRVQRAARTMQDKGDRN
ncbi:hypothetical protein LTR84_003372 [Exophiala bonariae]|uniref:Uncharacterized protein n=1 Tax=Exophiala bonariae TaxID=1690606 RepID=A0AAV9N6W5_9EURO|nr:hypothetical protein LTR84_003372 [Exophiala bonariae]